MNALLVPIVLAVGMLLPAQAAMNASMRRHLGDPFWAGVWNNGLGLFAMLLLALIVGQRPAEPIKSFAAAPYWAYWGGVLGAMLVVSSLVAAPRLGAGVLVACLVAGQLLSSLVFDHFALMGYPARPISAGRVAGAALLGCGVWLIRRF